MRRPSVASLTEGRLSLRKQLLSIQARHLHELVIPTQGSNRLNCRMTPVLASPLFRTEPLPQLGLASPRALH